MANFFDNFKNAGKIYPGVVLGTDQDGNVRLNNGLVRNVNLPSSGNDGGDSGAWRERVAVPFSYTNTDRNGNQAKKTGILYLPSYEATKIRGNGTVKKGKEPIEIYGAEINGQSLTKDGFMDIFNDYSNSDFKFDMQTATQALKDATGEKELGGKASTAKPFKANVDNFISNLRSSLWGL